MDLSQIQKTNGRCERDGEIWRVLKRSKVYSFLLVINEKCIFFNKTSINCIWRDVTN